MKNRQVFLLFSIFFSVFSGLGVHNVGAQSFVADSLVARGDSLRKAYRFPESVQAYTAALELPADTTCQDSLFRLAVSDRILLSENGKSLASYVYSPTVVAKHKFSIDDFFLYYPLKDRSWRIAPNQLDTLPDKFSKAIYAPADDRSIYFSAVDKDNIRNIYRTVHRDTVWSAPSLLNELLTSDSNEIYPMLSPDGQSLFFASDGLYGVGGYDLYVSHWDEASGDWSQPVNMGFPYSSPANDFLLINTDDGKYTIFASDRDCSKDSVWVYVLEHESVPVRNRVGEPEALARIARLEPSDRVSVDKDAGSVKSEIPENADMRRYMDKMAQVRALKDSISICEGRLAEYREKYSIIDHEGERKKIAERILNEESQIPGFRSRLEAAVEQLQKIEMDFLFCGIVIDPGKLLEEAEREIISESPGYVFSRMNMGEPLSLELERPEQQPDYSFRILPQGQIIQDSVIPEGIVYQIQIFSIGDRAQVADLKGLSPVFESRTDNGRYVYRVGVFSTYADVLSNLNTVRKLGFRNAFIVGYIDGHEVPVGQAREKETHINK